MEKLRVLATLAAIAAAVMVETLLGRRTVPARQR